jgi:molybdenum cofactor cytidylyltransferase
MNVAIILAAGESRRMGEPKQLLPFGNKTMLECVLDAFDSPKIAQTIVVLGHKADVIGSRIGYTRAKIVQNPSFAKGMFTSVQAGLRALPRGAKVVLIALCDQPRLKRATVEKLVVTFERQKHKILVPSIDGRQGHPLLLSARYLKEILAMDETLTLKHFLANHDDDIARLVVDDKSVLVDIDDRATYNRESREL